MKSYLILLFGLVLLFSNIINAKYIVDKNKKDNIVKNIIQESELEYHFANADETTVLLLSNHDYFNNLNQNDLNYRMQKQNATLEEYEEFVKKQVMDFTDKDKIEINKAINFIKEKCKEHGYTLPSFNNIVFAKTTILEEGYGQAYTHGNQIYLSEDILSWADEGEDFYRIIAHELFHCFTRNNPDFRKQMYNIIGFTVMDKDFDFPKETLDRIYSNPDVEHHNSYATFDINGEKKKCVVILSITKPFEEVGDSIEDYSFIGLVPIDDLYTIYNSEDASNFWDVFGRNTNYVIDPEEAMAENFSKIIIYGPDSDDGDEYNTPSIIKNIDAYLKSYKP